MANYQLLKADIDKKVYQNGHQEITGEDLNSVLNSMVTTLGAEYQFAGVATKDTNPEVSDAKVFYIANGKGTYTNFGNVEVTEDEVVVLYWDTAWHKEATGIASQAKLTELGEKLGEPIPLFVLTGATVYNTGNIAYNEAFSVYYVTCKNGQKLHLHLEDTEVRATTYGFFDNVEVAATSNNVAVSEYNKIKDIDVISDRNGYFAFSVQNAVFVSCYVVDNDSIKGQLSELTNTKEDKSNKVTSLSESSTDNQYPSAKCVYSIKSGLEITKEVLGLPKDISVMEGATIYPTGNIGLIENYSVYYVPCKQGDKIRVRIVDSEPRIAIYGVFTEISASATSVVESSANSAIKDFVVNIASDGYFAFSVMNSVIISANVYNYQGYFEGSAIKRMPCDWTSGYVDEEGNVQSHATATYSSFIPLIPGNKYFYRVSRGYLYAAKVGLYESNDLATIKYVVANGNDGLVAEGTFVCPNDCHYAVVCNIDAYTPNDIAGIYSLDEWTLNKLPKLYDLNKLSIKDSQLQLHNNRVGDYGYNGARRPLIAFIFDGNYDLNEQLSDIIYSHGYNVGIAPQYENLFYSSGLTLYHKWQDRGDEILIHGLYKLTDQEGMTEEEVKEKIKEAYLYPQKWGIVPKGYIAVQGYCEEKFYPTIKQYFEYAATTNNKSGDAEYKYLRFSSDSPYKLWRYSLQQSTLDQMKAAVDEAIANNGLLLFYTHARSEGIGNSTPENIEALCTYIDTKVSLHQVQVKTPYESIKDYYAIRYEDIINV